MRRLAFAMLACFSLAALTALPVAATQFEMGEEDAESLSEEAREAYEAGLVHEDHIRYDEALACYLDAMRLDPTHVEVRHLVHRLAMRQARKKSGKDAVQQLRIAQQACQEIAQLKGRGASSDDLRRADANQARVEELIRGQAERDLRRQEMGSAILKEQARAIRDAIEERQKKQKAEKAENKKKRRDNNDDLPGGSMGGMGSSRGGG